MKTAIKITALLLATIAALSFFGWVLAVKELSEYCDRLVSVSLLQPKFKPQPTAIAIRRMGKAIAPNISIKIKESRPNYAAMTIRELKALSKGTGIKGWEKLRKAELVAVLSAI